MGIASFLGGLGESAQKANLQQAQLEHEGNEHMAQSLELLAQNAKPEYAPDYIKAAAQYRMLKLGQKPGKDLDVRNIMVRQLGDTQKAQQLQAMHEQEVQRRIAQTVGQPAGAPQGGNNGLPPPPPAGMAGLPDPSETQTPLPDTQALVNNTSAQPPPPTPPPGSANLPLPPSSTPPGGFMTHPDGSPTTPPEKQITSTTPASQIAAPGVTQPDGSAVPNAPAAGFTNGQLPPPPGHPTSGQVFTQYTPEERMQMTARGEALKYGAQNQAELERTKAMAQFQREQRAQVVADLKAKGVHLDPRIEAQIASGQSIAPSRAAFNVPGLMAGSALPSGTVDAFGNPADAGKQYRVQVNPETGTPAYYPEIGTTKAGVEVAPDGKSASKVIRDAQGNEVSRSAIALPASYANRTTSSTHTQYIDVGGQKVPVQVGSSSTRGVSLPGAGGASAGGGSTRPSSGGSAGRSLPAPPRATGLTKGLNPKQQMDIEQKAGALDNTIEIGRRIQADLPMLANVLTAKKIQFETEPTTGFIHGIINRSLPMSPQEAQAAGDLQSMAEHINTLRGPLGATGFRGADAFKNLLAQGGSAMQNPEVTGRVLENTLKALETQRGIYAKHGVGLPPPPAASAAPTASAPTAAAPKAPATQAQPAAKEVTDRKEYDALPKGAYYMQNGVRYQKTR